MPSTGDNHRNQTASRADGTPSAVVVDDSQFMRTVITDILEDGEIRVAAEARNGRAAIDAVESHQPDVVTMDVEMPEMDGLEAVDRIMAEHPTPILMLSAHTGDGADVTFEALDKGAVDFFTKPGGEVSMQMTRFEDQLVEKVRTVARSDISSTHEGMSSGASLDPGIKRLDDPATVVIGSSTGGPNVVETILDDLPADIGLRVVVVQHMPQGFTDRFADRLDRHTAFSVAEATDGATLTEGEAIVAKGGSHLQVEGTRNGEVDLSLTDGPPENGVRPAIDVTMRSAARTLDGDLVGVVLTGMGRDGAAGVEAIAGAGGSVVVQDEATSSVFGMPKRALETGVVDTVLPAGDLANGIVETVSEP